MKKVLLFVFIGLLLLAIPATIFYLGQQRDVRAKAAPATTLTLSPANATVNVGDTVKLNVNITPGSNQVVSALIHVTFDATKFTAVSITNGPNAPRILNSGIVGSGTANITVAAASNAQPITASGVIAVITLTATGGTTAINPAQVVFASDTFVNALAEPNSNVLVGTYGSKITVNGGSAATGTPTLTPAPTSTPSATITPKLSPTLTPVLTPTGAASGSAEASSSAITIVLPADNGSTTSAKPVIRGKAPPGSTVTIVIHSDPQTCVAVADADGNYSCVPDQPLDPGPHEVTASVQTASGSTEIATDSFVVVGSGTGGGTSTQEAMPVSGSIENTVLLITLALILLGSGSLLWLF